MSCKHEDTYYIDDIPLIDTIEVCKNCGLSRAHWEQGESNWYKVNLKDSRKEYTDLENKICK